MMNTGVIVSREAAGRAMYVQPDGRLYLSRHYRILSSTDDGKTWVHVTTMPRPFARRLAELSRLACRLLRHEAKAFAVLSDGTYLAGNRDYIFWAGPGESVMKPSRADQGRIPVWPPMTITVGPSDIILWGEYGGSEHNPRAVRVYASVDKGRSYEVTHVFKPGEIRHVHNVVYDRHLPGFWVLTGDHDHEPGIGRLSLDLRDFEWIVKGKQCYRAVEVFDFGDHLVYGTDSEKEPNAIIRFDKRSGRTERLQELPGSCIYACRFGGLYVVSTTVEPSQVNRCTEASLWVSRDGERWSKIYGAVKDRWHGVYFQFGSIVLPRGASNKETLFFSGQALEGIDGRAYVGRLADGSEDTTR